MKKTRCSNGFTIIEIIIVFFILGILITIAIPEVERSRKVANLAEAQQGMNVLATGIFAYKDSTMTGGHFPPAGGVMQSGWSPWTDRASGMDPNSSDNHFHACSILWLGGAFYSQKGDDRAQFAASPPVSNTHYDLRVLTSPVETLTVIPRDPFKENGEFERSQYEYFGINLMEEFVLRSLGPDGTADIGCEVNGFNCGCIEADCLQLGSTLPGRRVFDMSVDSNFGCPGCTTLNEALRLGEAVYSPTNGVESRGDLFFTSAEGNPGVSKVSHWEVY